MEKLDQWLQNLTSGQRQKLYRAGAVLFLLAAKPRSGFMFDLGLLAALAGESLRIWSAGQLGAGAGSKQGPYALSPDPMELGAFAKVFGYGLMCTSIWHWLATPIAWGLVYADYRWRRNRQIQLPDIERWSDAVKTSRWNMDQTRRNRETRIFWMMWGIILLIRFKMVYRI